VGVWYIIIGPRIIEPIFFKEIVESTANLHVSSHCVEQLDDMELNECYFQ